MMLPLLLHLACSTTPPDAAPFAGVLEALDRDNDGVVTLAEYPAHSPGGAVPTKVDRDGNGRLSASEVRDEVYAVDPANFDKMAWAHSGTKPGAATSERPAPGPLAEALRFLVDLRESRAPSPAVVTEDEIEAAAAAGMASPAGQIVLGKLVAAGIELPSGFSTAPADPPPLARLNAPSTSMADSERLQSDGPGGAVALRVPRTKARAPGRGGPPPGRGAAPHVRPPPGDDVPPAVAP